MYDSVYSTLDAAIKSTIESAFRTSRAIELTKINGQIGGQDCSVYAIALSMLFKVRKSGSQLFRSRKTVSRHSLFIAVLPISNSTRAT